MSVYYEEGPYVCEITAQALGKAKTGTPQFVLQFKVLGGAQEYQRTIYMAITDKTFEYVVAALERLGYQASTFGPLDPSHPEHESFAGRQVEVYCKHERDQSGEMRERWRISRGPSVLKVDPLDSKSVRTIDALFGKELRRGLAPQPAKKQEALVITDDDIPF